MHAPCSFFNLHSLAGKTSSSNLNLGLPTIYPSERHFFTNISISSSSMAGERKKKGRGNDSVKRKRVVLAACKEENSSSVVGDIEDFSIEETLKIRASLLDWYYKNQRVLPWRVNQEDDNEEATEEEDPCVGRAYAVWVSEVMLQQTRVATVINYYERWMKKWPTLHHLAQASQEMFEIVQEVNEVWAGLGYYRRARFLLEGAKSIAGGNFPRTVSALRKVPGIGDYTAGAIASIAFKQVVPVVDGNVIRVIARLKAISANPKESATVKSFWKLAGQLVDPFRPGDFNQALMELGATVCTPTSPLCSSCPVSDQCRALLIAEKCNSSSPITKGVAESLQVTDFPMRVAKAKQRHDFAAVCVVEISVEWDPAIGKGNNTNNVFLLRKRPDAGLLAGLWEFPSILLDKRHADSSTRREAMDQFLKNSFNLDINKNCRVISRDDVGENVHIFTHIRLRMYVELLVLCLKGGVNVLHGKDDQDMTRKLVDDKSIQDMGLTSGVRKVYNMIQEFKHNGLSKNLATPTRKKRSLRP